MSDYEMQVFCQPYVHEIGLTGTIVGFVLAALLTSLAWSLALLWRRKGD